MKSEEIIALISYRLQRSNESIKAAEIMMQNKMLTFAGILPLELGRLYNKAFEYRQKFDYVDFSEPETEMVVTYLEGARKFIAVVEEYNEWSRQVAKSQREKGQRFV